MGNSSNQGTGGATRISPLFNDVFLKVFGSPDSKPATRILVNAILTSVGIEPIGEIRELSADAVSGSGIKLRTARLDVVVVSEEGTIVDLEAQRYHANVTNKALFYASKLLTEHMPKGGSGDYNDLPRIVSITLLEGHKVFEGDKDLSVAQMRWKRDRDTVDGTDRMVFVVVELDKIKKRYTEKGLGSIKDEGTAWLYALANGYRDDEEMDGLMSDFPTLREFAERYKRAIDDPEVKRAYDLYVESTLEYNQIVHDAQKKGHDEGYATGHDEGYATGHDEGYATGRDEGQREGRKEGRKEVIDRLRELGVDEATIAAVEDL